MKEITSERMKWCLEFLKTQKRGFTPFKHQWEDIVFYLQQDNLRALIADDQGLGKTITSLMVVSAVQAWYKSKGEEVDIYIIAPVSLRDNWYKEAKMIDLKIEVFSYSKMPVAREIVRPYIMVCDEIGHYAQNYKSARTTALLNLSLAYRCFGLLALSGTPMKNGRPSNLFSILRMLQHPLGIDKSFYEKRYCDAKATAFTAWDISGASNLSELNQKISNKVIRHLKEDCLDLPEKIYTSIQCEKNATADKEYSQKLQLLKDDYQRRVELNEISDASRAMVFMGYFRQLASLYKSYTTIDLAKDLVEQGHSVVIFTDFVESAVRIANHFSVPVLTGKTKNRQQIVEDFQSGVTKVFVGTIKAGGVGITLTKSQYLIMNDKPWTSADYVQACDRIHRIGQKGTCSIYDVYGKDVDYVVSAMLNHKQENIDKVLKKLRLTLDDVQSGNSYDTIVKALLK